VFIGEYSHSIDAKGRLTVPAKFREQLGDNFVVTGGLDGCLFIYTMEDWKAFEEKIQALPLTNPNARKFSRFFLASANEGEFDKQGRVLIPQKLRDMAGLSKDVILAGVGSRIEIWNVETWNNISHYDDMEEIAANMAELGI